MMSSGWKIETDALRLFAEAVMAFNKERESPGYMEQLKETATEKTARKKKEKAIKKQLEKKKEYQKKYRARKKLEKQVHKIMMQVRAIEEEHRNKYNRFDMMDLDD